MLSKPNLDVITIVEDDREIHYHRLYRINIHEKYILEHKVIEKKNKTVVKIYDYNIADPTEQSVIFLDNETIGIAPYYEKNIIQIRGFCYKFNLN